MDRLSRLLLVALLLAFSGWRLLRYLRLGMAKRPVGLASGAGVLVQSTASPAAAAGPTPPASFTGIVAAIAFWVVANVAIVIVLFRLPLLRDLPPILLLVAAVFANFYLIPQARRLATRRSP